MVRVSNIRYDITFESVKTPFAGHFRSEWSKCRVNKQRASLWFAKHALVWVLIVTRLQSLSKRKHRSWQPRPGFSNASPDLVSRTRSNYPRVNRPWGSRRKSAQIRRRTRRHVMHVRKLHRGHENSCGQVRNKLLSFGAAPTTFFNYTRPYIKMWVRGRTLGFPSAYRIARQGSAAKPFVSV